MKTHLTRQAKTRRDSGELTRDQKRAREHRQPEPELGPGHWVRRGIQPEVEPAKPSGLTRLMRLAQEIREESNPAAKAMLEARYRQEAVALAELVLDVNETKLLGVHAEITSTFGQIATQPLDVAGLTRGDWQELHHALLVCCRRSMQWLAVSRRFGRERWGETFVDDAEDNPPHARRHAQEPRSAVATLDACHGATPLPAPSHAPPLRNLLGASPNSIHALQRPSACVIQNL